MKQRSVCDILFRSAAIVQTEVTACGSPYPFVVCIPFSCCIPVTSCARWSHLIPQTRPTFPTSIYIPTTLDDATNLSCAFLWKRGHTPVSRIRRHLCRCVSLFCALKNSVVHGSDGCHGCGTGSGAATSRNSRSLPMDRPAHHWRLPLYETFTEDFHIAWSSIFRITDSTRCEWTDLCRYRFGPGSRVRLQAEFEMRVWC